MPVHNADIGAVFEEIADLKGIEVNILEDGHLDLPDSVLSRLDLVIGAVHSAFELPRGEQTARLLRVFDFAHLRFGIGQARRGWLEAADVLNTRTLAELKPRLKRTMG